MAVPHATIDDQRTNVRRSRAHIFFLANLVVYQPFRVRRLDSRRRFDRQKEERKREARLFPANSSVGESDIMKTAAFSSQQRSRQRRATRYTANNVTRLTIGRSNVWQRLYKSMKEEKPKWKGEYLFRRRSRRWYFISLRIGETKNRLDRNCLK